MLSACYHGTWFTKFVPEDMSTSRRIARELAVIVMPQLPKDRAKLDRYELELFVSKAVHVLCDYAKQNLDDASALIKRCAGEVSDIEIEHPDNAQSLELQPVNLTSQQIAEQLVNLRMAISFIAEALDIPEMTLHAGQDPVQVKCNKCLHENEIYVKRADHSDVRDFVINLIGTYVEHRHEVDEFIKQAKSRWQVERMVSIDRDILRLASTEALFMPDVPISVCINEAVELSHRFADDKAARFINGILGDLAKGAHYFRRHGQFAKDQFEDVESAPEAEASRGEDQGITLV